MSSVTYTSLEKELNKPFPVKATKAGSMRVVRPQRKPSQAKIKHEFEKQKWGKLLDKARDTNDENLSNMIHDQMLVNEIEKIMDEDYVPRILYKRLYEGAIKKFEEAKSKSDSLNVDQEYYNNILDKAITMCKQYEISKSDLEFILTEFVSLDACITAIEHGQDPRQLMTCFLYALWQAGCDIDIVRQLMFRVKDMGTKYTSKKVWDPIMKEIGICIRVDKLDLDADGENRLRTFYIGKPYKEVKYDSITNCYPNNDYFEFGMIRSKKEDFGHWFFNSVCDISPYYLEHYDEINEYGQKHKVPIQDLMQVNVKRNNGKFYHDSTKMDTIRSMDLIWFTWQRKGFEKMSSAEIMFYSLPLSEISSSKNF